MPTGDLQAATASAIDSICAGWKHHADRSQALLVGGQPLAVLACSMQEVQGSSPDEATTRVCLHVFRIAGCGCMHWCSLHNPHVTTSICSPRDDTVARKQPAVRDRSGSAGPSPEGPLQVPPPPPSGWPSYVCAHAKECTLSFR
jgi:hypothetical protein